MPYGACAAGDPHSALAGRNALMEGGNAIDAAVAAGLMAALTLPTMSGLGGGGLMTIRTGDRVEVLDFFSNLPGLGRDEPAPEAESIEVPFEDVTETFLIGPATVAVPGIVAGLWEAHRRHGRVPIKDLAFLVIAAAREGVEVTAAQYRAFALLQSVFRRSEEAWALLGDPWGLHPVGRKITNDAFAGTLEQLVEEGPTAFYEGDLGRAVTDVTEGLVTAEDLRRYEAIWRPPLESPYRGTTVYMPSVPSLSGGMLLTALSELGEGPPLPPRLDRAAWWRIADALRRSETVRTPEYEERLFEEGWLQSVIAASRSGNTMHLSTIDMEGNAVAYTSSVGEGSGLVPEGTGFTLNNFLGEPDILPKGERTAGRRMMTSMCPTLVRQADDRWMALGSAGSDRIRSAILQVIVHRVDGGTGLQEAVSRPRIHTRDDVLFVEGFGRTPEQVKDLSDYGLRTEFTWTPGFFFGGAQAVAETEGGFDVGADTVRRSAAGYLA